MNNAVQHCSLFSILYIIVKALWSGGNVPGRPAKRAWVQIPLEPPWNDFQQKRLIWQLRLRRHLRKRLLNLYLFIHSFIHSLHLCFFWQITLMMINIMLYLIYL